MAWYDFPITQAHQTSQPGHGETGVDLGVPFHTPITALFPGTVTSIVRGGWGLMANVTSFVPGLGTETTNYTHLDTARVHVGQYIPAGAVLGLSGGQLSGGSNPARRPFSTGPHVEFNVFSGTAFASHAYDPTGIITAARSGTLGTGGGYVDSSSGGNTNSGGPLDWVGQLGSIVTGNAASAFSTAASDAGKGAQTVTSDAGKGAQTVASKLDPTQIIHNALVGGLERAGFFVLALVILLFGGLVLFWPQVQAGTGKAVDAARVAAVA